MRFGIRLGPFWVSTSTRRKRRRPQASHRPESYHAVFRDEHGQERRCAHNHRTQQAAEECAARENRRREAEERKRQEAAAFVAAHERTLDEQDRWREVLEAIGPVCPSCGTESYRAWEHVSGELGRPGSVMRCRFCGEEARARNAGDPPAPDVTPGPYDT
jgi:hypothetical protein